jgi:hypothetical protein
MSNHPFLNPQSSRATLASHHEQLDEFKIWFSGVAGSLLAALGNSIAWQLANRFSGSPLSFSAGAIGIVSVSIGLGTTLAVSLLNRFTPRPLMILRLGALLIFLGGVIALVSFSFGTNERLWLIIMMVIESVAVLTPLTVYSR